LDSGSSHTGGLETRGKEKEVMSPAKYRHGLPDDRDNVAATPVKKSKGGTYVRKQRKVTDGSQSLPRRDRTDARAKKRGSNQMWLSVNREGGSQDNINGKKQKVASVYDHISDPIGTSASHARQDRRAQ
jgi:hypothetical protein